MGALQRRRPDPPRGRAAAMTPFTPANMTDSDDEEEVAPPRPLPDHAAALVADGQAQAEQVRGR